MCGAYIVALERFTSAKVSPGQRKCLFPGPHRPQDLVCYNVTLLVVQLEGERSVRSIDLLTSHRVNVCRVAVYTNVPKTAIAISHH